MPDWARTEHYDITARGTVVSTGTAPVLAMLRTLLQTRFGLRFHTETRDLPIYVLRSRPGGQLGAQLTPSDADCSTFNPGVIEELPLARGPYCGIQGRPNRPGSSAMRYELRGRSMAKLASDLELFTGRPVRDETGVTGRYDVQLEFVADGTPALRAGDEGVPLVTAIQEQLGLRLEAARGPVDVVVIDFVDRPTPD
jgi:uncharacterized protein (TIGR03435 family)